MTHFNWKYWDKKIVLSLPINVSYDMFMLCWIGVSNLANFMLKISTILLLSYFKYVIFRLLLKTISVSKLEIEYSWKYLDK